VVGVGDGAEPAGELLAAGAAEHPGGPHVDAGVDECGGDALGQVLELVGGFGADAGAQVEIVDLIDFTDRSGPDLPPDLR
jgi:hypothetical protein